MTKFFTSDEHYHHKNVIRYCNRPYKNINEMNKALIENHNNIVSKDDIVYHLGDFSMISRSQGQKLESIINNLNGMNILILGNHDDLLPFTYVNMGFASVHTALYVEEFLLIHDPAMAVAVDDDQKVLCGHLHELTKFVNPCILNVGVDIWDYKPVSIDTVRRVFDNE
ncbi:MAG: hypothetical protein ACOCQD_03910 [archaeon]